MTTINPRHLSKWQVAARMFRAKMAELDGSLAIEYFVAEAAKQRRLAAQHPESVAYIRAARAADAATYGVNLAFGHDLAK